MSTEYASCQLMDDMQYWTDMTLKNRLTGAPVCLLSTESAIQQLVMDIYAKDFQENNYKPVEPIKVELINKMADGKLIFTTATYGFKNQNFFFDLELCVKRPSADFYREGGMS